MADGKEVFTESSNIVQFLKTNSGKKGQGMPVVRNPQFYFREGFCWNNVLNPMARLLKAKLKMKSVNDVGSMSLSSLTDKLPNPIYVALLNSELLFDYYRDFINCTVNIQINDIRQLPVIIPSKEQITELLPLINRAVILKKSVAAQTATDSEIESELSKIEHELNKSVQRLYSI